MHGLEDIGLYGSEIFISSQSQVYFYLKPTQSALNAAQNDSSVFNGDYQLVIAISSGKYTSSEFGKSPITKTLEQFFVDLSHDTEQSDVFYMTKNEV